jgi:hypothetical protein
LAKEIGGFLTPRQEALPVAPNKPLPLPPSVFQAGEGGSKSRPRRNPIDENDSDLDPPWIPSSRRRPRREGFQGGAMGVKSVPVRSVRSEGQELFPVGEATNVRPPPQAETDEVLFSLRQEAPKTPTRLSTGPRAAGLHGRTKMNVDTIAEEGGKLDSSRKSAQLTI